MTYPHEWHTIKEVFNQSGGWHKTNRGERRRRTENKRKKAMKTLKQCGLENKTVKMFNNMKQCSCPMCCNVRRSIAPKKERLTRGERRQIEELHLFHKNEL